MENKWNVLMVLILVVIAAFGGEARRDPCERQCYLVCYSSVSDPHCYRNCVDHICRHIPPITSTSYSSDEVETRDGLVLLAQTSTPMVRSRSQETTRHVTPTPFFDVEKPLPTSQRRSLYRKLLRRVSTRSDKYILKDGCMYEDDWKRGKASGKGIFLWPSGATYEGEFKSGKMEESVTFAGADGDTYRRIWVADRKHGHGQKRYREWRFLRRYLKKESGKW